MKLRFTSKFEKQISKIDSRKIKEEIKNIIEAAEKAEFIYEIKNIKKLAGHRFH